MTRLLVLVGPVLGRQGVIARQLEIESRMAGGDQVVIDFLGAIPDVTRDAQFGRFTRFFVFRSPWFFSLSSEDSSLNPR
jgi:hypothetical protein